MAKALPKKPPVVRAQKPTKTRSFEEQLAALATEQAALQKQKDELADQGRQQAAKQREIEALIVERDNLAMGAKAREYGYTLATLEALLAREHDGHEVSLAGVSDADEEDL